MKTTETIYLTSNVTSVTGISPFSLTIDPINIENLLLNKKIYKIQYDFGNGNVITEFANFNPSDKLTLHPKTVVYNITDPKVTSFFVKVSIYQINKISPVEFNYGIHLQIPSIEKIFSTDYKNMFESMHLVGTRMFGTNNNILYFFQSKNPDYILPAIVNWDSVEPVYNEIYEKVKDYLPSQRAFILLSPFENEFVTSIDNGSVIGTVNKSNYFGGEWKLKETPDDAEV